MARGTSAMGRIGLQGIAVAAMMLILAIIIAAYSKQFPLLQGWALSHQSKGKMLAQAFFFFLVLAVGGDWLVRGFRTWKREYRAARAPTAQEDTQHSGAFRAAADKAQEKLINATKTALEQEAQAKIQAAKEAAEALEEDRRSRALEQERAKKAKAERDAKSAEEAAAVREEIRRRHTLRAEQDEEYQEALRQDREKHEKELDRQKAKEEEKARREAEEAAKVAALQALKASLPAEPERGAPGVASLRLRLPDGFRHRSFMAEDDISVVHTWVQADEAAPPGHDTYKLVVPFPRQELPRSGSTLLDLGLAPQAVILLELADD